MNELLISLVTTATLLANVPPPTNLPVVQAISQQKLQELACDNRTTCTDLHVFTAPDTGVIYVNEKVNWNFTFAQAELFHEVSRYVLSVNGIYSQFNACSRNVEIEHALDRMRFDYIKTAVVNGNYDGYGLPEPDDLPKHIFFCEPDKKVEHTNI